MNSRSRSSTLRLVVGSLVVSAAVVLSSIPFHSVDVRHTEPEARIDVHSLSDSELVDAMQYGCSRGHFGQLVSEALQRGLDVHRIIVESLGECDGSCCVDVLLALSAYPEVAKQYTAQIRRRVHDNVPAVRVVAVRCIIAGRLFDEETMTALWSAMERPNFEGGTADALFDSGPVARSALMRLVESRREPVDRRLAAAGALAIGTGMDGTREERSALRGWLRAVAQEESAEELREHFLMLSSEEFIPIDED